MTLSADTVLVVSLMMAVFAAVSTVGSSLFLGAGFERLRAGFETIKKQTAFFSTAIHDLDTRVDAVEKQSGYFFEAINNLEQPTQEQDAIQNEHQSVAASAEGGLIVAGRSEALHAGTGNLLTDIGFLNHPAAMETSAEPEQEQEPEALHFH